MKRLIFLFTLLLSVYFSNADEIRKTFYFNNPIVNTTGDFQTISFDNTMLTGIAGEPSFPYMATSLLLPPGEEAISIKIELGQKVSLKGKFTLFPYQSSRPLSDPGNHSFNINKEVYSANQDLPRQKHGNISTHYLYGHSIAMTTITPIVYNPANKTVEYYKEVTVIINTKTSQKAQIALDNFSADSDIEKYIQNPELTSRYNISKKMSENPYKLLIITPETFMADFDTLRNIYLSRGITSEIISPNYIITHISGQDTPEKIRNYIIQEYQESGIEYVILGGDIQHVPHRSFYCSVESGSGYSSDDIPADLYYSALDGNWDTDGDNLWGEPDEDDLLPELAVARFPFGDADELENIIHKSISYQNTPVLGEFTNNLMAGENLYSNPDTWGRDYLDLLIGERSDNGYTTIGIPDNYTIDSIYEHSSSWSGSTLMAHVNSGKQFVHHVGHANPTYVAHMSISDISNNNFSGANGIDHNYTLFHTHGCDCGSFDLNCILEKMVTIDNFAVSVIGNSRYGWFNEGQSEGPAAHLHREMVDALYHEKMNHLGKAFKEAKIQTAPWVEAPGQWEEGAIRWNFYDLNVLGDPVLSVWTDEPIDIDVAYENILPLGTTSSTVNITNDGTPMENFTCSVLKNGILHASAETDANGTAILNFNPVVTEIGDAQLIVVGYNCLPDTSIISFIPEAGPYVVYNDHEIIDINGNNNGEADYGENVQLTVEIINSGQDDASDVSSEISITDEFITLLDSVENYGSVTAGTIVSREEAYDIQIAPLTPDQHIASFTLECTSDNASWLSDFQVIVNAPEPLSGTMIINDENGNNNGKIDQGETVTIEIPVTNNGHSDCAGTTIVIGCDNTDITITQNTLDLGNISAGETVAASFEIYADEAIPNGTIIEFNSEIDMCGYINSSSCYQAIGIVMEDFETGDFTSYNWLHSGNMPWVITNNNVYNGDFSSKSGAISDEQSSSLDIEINVMQEGILSFARKVSSEADYDKLKILIDNELLGSWSGVIDWEVMSYTIQPGIHTLSWVYIKDMNSSSGDDCAWIDDIVFPPTSIIMDINEDISDNNVSVYPNPGNGLFHIFANQGNTIVKVYNSLGSLIKETESNFVEGSSTIDLSNQKSGIYFIELTSETSRSVSKVIKR